MRRGEVPSSIGRLAPDVISGFPIARLALSQKLQGTGAGGVLLANAVETTLTAIRIDEPPSNQVKERVDVHASPPSTWTAFDFRWPPSRARNP